MANTPVRFQEGVVLATSDATIYTSPANTVSIIKQMSLTNFGAAAVTVTIHLVPSGGSAATSNVLCNGVVISAGGQAIVIYGAINHVLQAGDAVVAKSDTATSVNIIVSGFQVTP